MADPIEDETEPYHFKVVKDLGLTPGNDRALVLSCGHSVLVDVPHYTNGGPPGAWVGQLEYCSQCDDVP